LALIPKIKPKVEVPSLSVKPHLDDATSRIIRQNDSLLRYVIDSPLSRFAESFRAVKVGIDLGNVAKSNKVIGVTSSVPNEGKTLISASLAQLCTAGGARVILIDCDLRLPSLSQKLAPKATRGIIDVLTGSSDVENVIWTDPSTHLSFLPVAAKSRLTHTSEILASNAARQLFDRLRARYDYVIVDLSPLAPVVDARSTARLVDAYLFVVEWGKTGIGVVEHALSAANEVYENLLGVVLNKVDVKLLSRYDSDRGEYYYNDHYGRYGYTD
jgi:succinoglycan biosynthesis transport protein ExoP